MLLKLRFVRISVALLLVSQATGNLFAIDRAPLRISNRYSPLNKERPIRPYTRYIVLHTTEGEEKGSLNKVIRYGETHYFVAKSGKVYRIIHKAKIAKHAGRSMWEGITTIDNYSIGIEVSGYHNKDITDAQYVALRELLRQLKSLYHISDEDVITHSMVAYGRPNHFHKQNHRGRKRCGMIFAKPEVRARLGLKAAPERDVDVEAGRLKVADKKLFNFLFPDKPSSTPVASSAASVQLASAQTSSQEASVTQVSLESTSVASSAANRASVVPLSAAGYSQEESVLPVSSKSASAEIPQESCIIDGNRTAWEIARENYNHPSTVYIFPNGARITGDKIKDWAHIPANTRVIAEQDDTEPFEGFLEIGKDGDTAKEVAGMVSTSSTTIYFFPDGFIRTGAELNSRRSFQKLLSSPPKKTKVLVGYVYGGYVRSRRPPSSIAGVKWNYPSTYYRYPDGSILSGDDINDKEIPPGTLVFYQR
jgi:N-acetylmuramoyl-L-alanine amidase